MEKFSSLRHREHIQKMNTDGLLFAFEGNTLGGYKGVDLMYPYIILSLCLQGNASSLYDMQEIRIEKNDLTVVLPGHLLRPLDYSEDFSQAWMIFDPAKFTDSELKFNNSDLEHINQAPHCHLTDEQAKSLMNILGVVSYIVSRSENELPHRHHLLELQLTLAYNLYISIRREYDKKWASDRMAQLHLQFCNLVVAHYKEERNVNYYAEVLGYDPRYFSRIFRAYNKGMSPLEWIQQYIATQAKRLMSEHPNQTVKETAYQLGFPTTANFCRYFKRATGIYPKAFKELSRSYAAE